MCKASVGTDCRTEHSCRSCIVETAAFNTIHMFLRRYLIVKCDQRPERCRMRSLRLRADDQLNSADRFQVAEWSPSHMNCVLSTFSFSRFEAVHRLMSSIQHKSWTADAGSPTAKQLVELAVQVKETQTLELFPCVLTPETTELNRFIRIRYIRCVSTKFPLCVHP